MVCLAGLLIPVFVVVLLFVPKRYQSDRQVCVDCGVTRESQSRSIAGISYSQKELIESTPISKGIGLQNCEHDWLRYQFYGSYGKVIGGWIESAHGGNRALMTKFLMNDESLSQELATFPEPAETWRTLVMKIEEDPKADAALAQWWEKGLDRDPFRTWWSEHVNGTSTAP